MREVEVYTVPRFRRHCVQPHAGYLMRRDLKAQGYRRIVLLVASWNKAARDGARGAGWPVIGELQRWNAFGRSVYTCRGALRELRNGDIAIERYDPSDGSDTGANVTS